MVRTLNQSYNIYGNLTRTLIQSSALFDIDEYDLSAPTLKPIRRHIISSMEEEMFLLFEFEYCVCVMRGGTT